MKLDIQVSGQKISGGWVSWNYKKLESDKDSHYDTIRDELIKKLDLKVGPKTGRVKKVSKSITLGELASLELSVFMPDNFLHGRNSFSDTKVLNIKVSEWDN